MNILIKAIKRIARPIKAGAKRVLFLFKKSYQLLRREGFKGLWHKSLFYSKLSHEDRYPQWLEKNRLNDQDKFQITSIIGKLTYKPLISVLIPVYNVEEKWLRKCLDSVVNQLYPNWELCIADDASYLKFILVV